MKNKKRGKHTAYRANLQCICIRTQMNVLYFLIVTAEAGPAIPSLPRAVGISLISAK